MPSLEPLRNLLTWQEKILQSENTNSRIDNPEQKPEVKHQIEQEFSWKRMVDLGEIAERHDVEVTYTASKGENMYVLSTSGSYNNVAAFLTEAFGDSLDLFSLQFIQKRLADAKREQSTV